VVKSELRGHVRRRRKSLDPTGRWCLLAVDGSKEDFPRTQDHETVFGIADNGVYPQAFITAIVEVHTGLLWDWRIDGARASEKHHLLDMIPELPDDTLLLADAGFVGLPIWEKLNAQGTPFLIPVGGNVHLLTDLWPQTQTQQKRGIVYAWPYAARRTSPPLRLRLIKVGSGRKAVYLLTNVLDPRQLSKNAAGANGSGSTPPTRRCVVSPSMREHMPGPDSTSRFRGHDRRGCRVQNAVGSPGTSGRDRT
jgi:hypothetical protein